MKNSSSPPLPRPCTFCHFATAVAIASLWICASSRAATYTYSPTDSLLDQWTTGTNWNATPVSNAATILVFGPSGSFSSALTNTSTNDFASPFQLNVLTLQGTGPTATGSPVAVTIVGGTLNFQSSPQINLNASNGAGTSTVSYTINSNISLSSPLTITGDGTAAFAFGGVISGSQSITKSGTSTVTLSGANSYTGTTTISAGTIKLGSAGNATNTPLGSASSTTRVTPGGTLDLDGYSLVAARPLALGQSGATSAAALINSSATAATYSGTISMADNFQQIGGAGDITATGIISGTGNWTKAGTNTLTLSASNTFSGNLFIDNGTVKLGAAGNATNSPLGTTGGYTLIGNAGTPATLDLNGFTLGTAETLYLNAAGGRLINSSATPVAYSGAVNINSPSVASIGGAGNLTLTGVLGGIGTLTKEGAGMLTLSAANTFRGTLVVSTGSLAVTNSLALQDTVLARNVGEGPVTFGGLPAVTIGGLTGSDSFDLDVSVFSIGGQTSSAFSGTLTGANGFTKSGSATLTLSGTSTYSGPTTVSSGMLSFLKPASLYNNTPGAWTATNLIVNSGATLAFGVGGAGAFATGDITTLSALGTGSGGFRNGSSLGLDTTGGDFSYGGVIADTNSGANAIGFAKLGANTLTLSGANSYSGPTTISGGTLKLGSAGDGTNSPLGTAASGTTIALDAVLDLNGFTISTAEPLTYISNSSTTVVLTNSSATPAIYAGPITAAQYGAIGGTGDISLTNTISGLNVWKVDANTLTLSGNNTFTDTVIAYAGTIKLGAAGNATNTPLGTIANGTEIRSGATLDLNGFTLSAAEPLTIAGTGVGNLGALINSAATTAAYSGPVTISNSNSINIGGTGDITLTGVVSGSGSLTKAGANTLTLAAADTFTGTLAVASGTLAVANALALQSATLSRSPGDGAVSFGALPAVTIGGLTGTGSIAFGATTPSIGGTAITSTFSGTLTGTGGFTKIGTGTFTFSNTTAYTGTTTVSAGTLDFQKRSPLHDDTPASWTTSNLVVNSGGILAVGVGSTSDLFTAADIATLTSLATASGGFKSGSFLGLDTTAGDFSYAANIGNLNGGANVLGLTKLGANTLILSGANTYTGGTRLAGGTLSLGSSGSIGTTGSITFAGGTLQFTSSNTTDYSSRFVVGNNLRYNFDVSGAATSVTLASVLSGTNSSLTKSGAGTLTLSGTNTYTGGTTISGGTLVMNNTRAVNNTTTTNMTIGAGATLDSSTFGFLLSRITAASTGTLTGSGAYTHTTGTTVLSVLLAGTASLTKSGTGTLTLSAANTYSGLTTISGGTVKLGATGDATNSPLGTIAAGTAVTSGGALDLNGFTLGTAEALSLDGTGVSSNGALTNTSATAAGYSGAVTLTANASIGGTGNITLTNTLGGGFALTKVGANTLTLSASNTYTGSTTVSAGILQFAKEISFYNNTPASWNKLTVASGATGAFNLGGAGEFTESDITAILASATFSSGSALGIDTTNLVGPYTFSRTLPAGIGFTMVGSNTTILAVALNNAPLRVSGGILDLNDLSQSISSLNSTAGTILNNGSTTASLTLLAGTTASTNAAVIADNNNAGVGKVAVIVNNTDPAPGLLTLSGANTFTGGLLIKAGSVSATANSLGGSGTGGVTLGDTSGSANASLYGSAITYANSITIAAGSSGTRRIGSTSASAIFSGPITLNNSLVIGNGGSSTLGVTVSGAITGSSPISIEGGAAATAVTLSGTNTAFTGPVTIASGTLKAGHANAFSFANLLTLSSGTTFDLNDFSIAVAGLAGSGTDGTVTQSNTSNIRTLTLAGSGAYSFGGKITAAIPANLSLIVVLDPGFSQEFTGTTNDYAGGTAIHSGTLIVSNGTAGSGTGSGPVSVDVGATLTGSFTISGATQMDGTLSPGKNGVGVANFGGNLTLGSTATTNIEISGDTSFDTINVGDTFTLGGTLKIITTGGYLAQGSYKVIGWSVLVSTGFDPNVNIDFSQADTGPGGYWNTSQFLTNGTLVAVPEPGETAAALAALLGAIILLRSRRKIAGP